MIPRLSVSLLLAFVSTVSFQARANEPAKPKDTQAETVRLSTPEEAAASFSVPEGFRVSLFAAEPVIRQPIAITSDEKGRLWVAENYTYAESALNYDLSQHDRIMILEDTDHDGKADRHKVFWDRGQKLTSVELGFGGVWALCPPRLLFIPDGNGDDVPDGEPEVILDGWDHESIRHNIANGLRWGPDGWLYGRHGIQATSYVGAPGTPKSERVAVNCSIWRYHPTRKVFEVVCRGGTNSWGHDWDEHGELFYINTVIGHLWHGIPGAYGQRMYGEHDNPHLYELLGQTADHFHWDTAETWDKIRKGVSPTTDQAGGGHAHTGLLIYQGDNWPEKYRGKLFTLNFHGRRVNSDTMERQGASYVGWHGKDFLKSTDPWFRPIDLITGDDGGVYIADWSDIGECHENDGVHRSSGRIYKIVYEDPEKPKVANLSGLDDLSLIYVTSHENAWNSRQARRILQERAVAGRPMGDVHENLKKRFEVVASAEQKLRFLWALYSTGGAPDSWLLSQLKHDDEHVRVWAIRLLADGKTPTSEAIKAMTAMAPGERSGLVLLYLASTLQKMPTADRWPLAEGLAGRSEYADDPVLPLMIWYGLEPVVPDDPARAVRLAGSSGIPLLSRLITRRVSENIDQVSTPVAALVSLAAQSKPDRSRLILTGMTEALRGRRKAPAPASWASARKVFENSDDETVKRLCRELSVVFGDGRALEEVLRIASSGSSSLSSRRDAIRVLVEARDTKVLPLLRDLITDRDLGADAARSLAAFDDPDTARLLIARFRAMKPPARVEAVVTLAGRPASALAMLEAVASGTIERDQVSAFQVRQMLGFPDEKVRRRVAELWPAPRAIPVAKRAQIERLKAQLSPQRLATSDLSNGRGQFVKACATCHTLFGQGGKIGPDLTGAQRQNLEYLLENVVDPSANVSNDYRMSAISLNDGRVLNGIVGSRTGPTLTVQTPTERLVVNRSDVEAIKDSTLSLMPDGLLDTLAGSDLNDLIAYLMSPQQVPLSVESAVSERPKR